MFNTTNTLKMKIEVFVQVSEDLAQSSQTDTLRAQSRFFGMYHHKPRRACPH